MALIGSGDRRVKVRRGVAKALRWAAVQLKDAVEIDEGPVQADAQPTEEGAEAERFGAARYVAEHQKDDEGLSEGDLALLSGLSGDFTPVVDARAAEARERVSGADSSMHAQVIEALHTIFDPEIPVDIYDLGLIYEVDVRDDTSVGITMTLTSPNCPAAQSLPSEVEVKVGAIDGVGRVEVDVVFEPAWTPDLMSEEAKLELNIT